MNSITSIISSNFWLILMIAVFALSSSTRMIAACLCGMMLFGEYNKYLCWFFFLAGLLFHEYSSTMHVTVKDTTPLDDLDFDDDEDEDD